MSSRKKLIWSRTEVENDQVESDNETSKDDAEEIEVVDLTIATATNEDSGGNDDTARVYNEADVPVRNPEIIKRFWIEVMSSMQEKLFKKLKLWKIPKHPDTN